MAYSQADLDTLDAAIAAGALSVRTAEKTVTYFSIAELKAARAHIAEQLAIQAGRPRRAVFYFTPCGRRDR